MNFAVEDKRKYTETTLPTHVRKGAKLLLIEVTEGVFDVKKDGSEEATSQTQTPYRVLEENENVAVLFLDGNLEYNF